MLELVYLPNEISSGPEATLELLEEEFDKILSHRGACEIRIWGIGVGIPGPVEFRTGIGAGIISNGVLQRGPQGPSIICRCGNIGCLEVLASGAASLALDGIFAPKYFARRTDGDATPVLLPTAN